MQRQKYLDCKLENTPKGKLQAVFKRVVPYETTCFGVAGGVYAATFPKEQEVYSREGLEAYLHLNRYRLHKFDRDLMQNAMVEFEKAAKKPVIEPLTPEIPKKQGAFGKICSFIKRKMPF